MNQTAQTTIPKRNPKLKEFKQWLKGTAVEIRKTRKIHKEHQRKHGGSGDWRIQGKLKRLSWDYRHHHIAYSELRGRKYEQIEQPREGNEPDWGEIAVIESRYKTEEVTA